MTTMNKQKFLILSLLPALWIMLAVAPPALSDSPRPAQLTIAVVQRPDPMEAYGKAYLAYELLLTNYDASPVEVRSLRITDPKDQNVTFNFTGKRLREMMAPVGRGGNAETPTTLKSGASRLIFVWLEFGSPGEVPGRLAQFIGYRVKRGTAVEGEIEAPPLIVDDAPPVTIGPPLKGGDWLVGSALRYRLRENRTRRKNLLGQPEREQKLLLLRRRRNRRGGRQSGGRA
jgi:hypothetical protein